ncbi:hypothetical protein GQ43DRAFT_433832 [Delitschia confertaspora ATCC 74209]|uniref:Uncharacterized protein n=1 Tax=Delitschia confertaspora ATCC 74209 TaxID=1513339 RepID=A0A9P4MQ43_9PLEO|nr:hypothetical protein GQ43DRAFT_433832 [Delitschia confertaspora ATCC 74209]
MLTLPLELREEIYKLVLTSVPGNPRLLGTCRKIYLESQKVLFQRPMSFTSPSALQQWINHVGPTHLPQVEEIHLTLPDIDLTPLLGTLSTGPSQYMPRLLIWELYEEEIRRLSLALRQMPNIKAVTVTALSARQSFLYREYLGSFMEELGAVFPNLRHLTLNGNFHHQRLSFLSLMQQLRAFSFNGFSASSLSETTSIVSSLPYLSNLVLVSDDTALQSVQGGHNNLNERGQALTPDIIRQLRPLTSFSLTRRTEQDVPNGLPPLTDMLDALRYVHAHSLKSLSLKLSYTPDAELLNCLQSILDASSIEHLEYSWRGLDPETLDTLLPGSSRSLSISAASEEVGFDVLWAIIASREAGNVPKLARVVLVLGDDDSLGSLDYEGSNGKEVDGVNGNDSHTPSENLQLAIRNLRYHGVVVLKSTTNP